MTKTAIPSVPRLLADISDQWNEDFSLSSSVLFGFVVGSHSHGTYVPPNEPTGVDDVDYLLIVVPPPNRVYGLRRFSHATIKKDHYDVTIYSVDKYINLLIKSNPNVVGTLFLEKEFVYDPFSLYWTTVINLRKAIMSKQIYPAFVGYAKAQFYKMTHNAHQGYMGEKRKKLVQLHGYDTKNAAHLVRLLRMGTEALATGKMNVMRPDREEIIRIKRGRYTLQWVQDKASELFKDIDTVMSRCILQERPKVDEAEDFLMMYYTEIWNAQEWLPR